MKEEMSGVFSEQVLGDKLAKLNNSQQSIETLSHWCIFHRKKAKNIIETWFQQFNSSTKEQKVCLMYLANDILQNSKRKGSEFVNEFWKALPSALRNLMETGDEGGKKVVTRLIEIWDERKVFGSRSRALKDEIFGDSPPPPLVLENSNLNTNSNLNSSSNPVKVVRKDANTVRVKLAVGEMPEKIMTAYQSLLEKSSTEDSALNNSNSSIGHLDKIEKDINDAITKGNQQQVSVLLPEFEVKETGLKQSIEQLESVEIVRASLINQLKEALQEQEAKLEITRAQLQVARSKAENSSNLKHKLSLSSTNSDGSDFKKTAAEIAAKLAASSSSAQLFSSVLSSFALQQSNPNSTPNPNPSPNPNSTPNPNTDISSETKRPRLDTFVPYQTNMPPVPVSLPVPVSQFGGGFGFNGGSMPVPAPIQAPGQQGGFFQPQQGLGFFPLQPAPSAQRQQ